MMDNYRNHARKINEDFFTKCMVLHASASSMEWNDRKKSQVINVTFDPDRYRAVLWCDVICRARVADVVVIVVIAATTVVEIWRFPRKWLP